MPVRAAGVPLLGPIFYDLYLLRGSPDLRKLENDGT
jgi:hypothetical protein